MRRLISFLIGLIVLVAVIVLVVFSLENVRNVQVTFLGNVITASLWWFVVGAAILGFLVALLLLTPGRVVAGWRGWTLSRQGSRMQEDLAALRARHEQLRAEHDTLKAQHEGLTAEHTQVITERDRLRSQLAAPSTSVKGTSTATGAPYTIGAAPTGVPAAAPASVPTTAPAETVPNGTEPSTTLSGRLREMFRGPRPTDEPAQDQIYTPDGPAAPTA